MKSEIPGPEAESNSKSYVRPASSVVGFSRFLALAACQLLPTAIHADEPETDGAQPLQELFQTDLVYPQEKGEWQFTMAPSFRRERHGTAWEVPVSVEYGLSDAWQMEVEWTAFQWRKPSGDSVTHGIGDLELGTQYSFMSIAGSGFHIAPRFNVQFPTGDIDKEMTEGFIEYEPSLIIARDFPSLHHAQIFTQIGVGFVQRVKRPDDVDDLEPAAHEFVWNTGLFVPFEHWVISAELNWSNNRWNHGGGENELYVTPGFTWTMARRVEVGLGVPVGLNSQSDRFRLIGGLVFEF